jgi:H+-transporting ATPase
MPLGWKYAGLVWGYAFAWFLVTDPVKLLAYRILDLTKAGTTPQAEVARPAASQTKSDPSETAASFADGHADANANPEPKAIDMTQPSDHPATEGGSPTGADREDPGHGPSTAELGTFTKTMVSDLARAGMLHDPERAGHIVAGAIIAAETPSAAAKSPKPADDAGAKPDAKAKPEPKAEDAAPPDAHPAAEPAAAKTNGADPAQPVPPQDQQADSGSGADAASPADAPSGPTNAAEEQPQASAAHAEAPKAAA